MIEGLTIGEAARALDVSWRRELQPLLVRLGWLAVVDRGVYVTTHGAVAAGYLAPVTQARTVSVSTTREVNAEVGYRITPAGMIALRRIVAAC